MSTGEHPWPTRIIGAVILALPFLVLYWLVPFVGKYSIGNDYLSYWIRMQMYLQFSIRHGTFPLYAPGFNGGWTASALSFSQLWHPISWIASLLPGYWNGQAHELGTLLRVFSLGGTHLILFLFLRRLRLGLLLAFVLSFIAVYNLRMLDMFRYGPSLENYVAYLLLCAAVVWHYVTPTKRLGPTCIALSTWLLVVGGHPQMTYIGLLGAAIVTVVAPFYMAGLLPAEAVCTRRRVLKYYLSTFIFVLLGVFLASSYIIPFYFECLQDSYRAVSTDFLWACGCQDTLGGSLCNLFNPFHSDVTGAFGGSALLLVAVALPLLFLVGVRIAGPVLFVWLVSLITFILMLGSNGPLYYYFWRYFPLAHTFRVPGRLSLILPFMFMLLLVWIVSCKNLELKLLNRRLHLPVAALLALIAFVVFTVLNLLPLDVFRLQEAYTPFKLNEVQPISITLAIIGGIVSLVALALYSKLHSLQPVAGAVLVAAVLLQTTVILRYGTWVVRKPPPTPTFEQLSNYQREKLTFWGPSGDWSRVELNEHLKRTFLEPVLSHLSSKFAVVKTRQEAYERMARERSIDTVIVENYPAADAQKDEVAGTGRIELKYDSFNRLKFDVMCSQPAFFVFSYPYSDRWRAHVNSERVPVYRANGFEHAIWLPAGRSEVEWRYWSRPAVIGMGLSCSTLGLMGLFLLWNLRVRLVGQVGIIATVFACVLLFLVWYNSLYTGDNIATRYVWNTDAVKEHLSSRYNLAYGKKTAMSTNWSACEEDSPAGVDGLRDRGYGFDTGVGDHVWWQVDLGRNVQIAQILIYKRADTHIKCSFPFTVLVSADGEKWFLVQRIDGITDLKPWLISPKDVTARYVRLQTLGRGRLVLAEVEVYGPQAGGSS
ncbi:MAG: discoidin domain-containing protein [Sedimentisphaerales bacterium]|nr:discoidin domain-containing protein [Sedimentisphaerales bacterium]